MEQDNNDNEQLNSINSEDYEYDENENLVKKSNLNIKEEILDKSSIYDEEDENFDDEEDKEVEIDENEENDIEVGLAVEDNEINEENEIMYHGVVAEFLYNAQK